VLHVLGDRLTAVQNPSLVLMAVTYLGTLLANFESSSVAVLGLVLPVAVKSLGTGSSELLNSVSLAVICGSIAVISSSPFHLSGGIVLAETRGDERTFKDLLIWTLATASLLPLCGLLV
jgi:hypothetical protein